MRIGSSTAYRFIYTKVSYMLIIFARNKTTGPHVYFHNLKSSDHQTYTYRLILAQEIPSLFHLKDISSGL